MRWYVDFCATRNLWYLLSDSTTIIKRVGGFQNVAVNGKLVLTISLLTFWINSKTLMLLYSQRFVDLFPLKILLASSGGGTRN